jgi:heme-degrading monooxygenase HmoA
MLIKWIECAVADRDAFDHAQRAWTALRGVPGFLGQGGGWSRRRPGTAHVFGCWADRTAYDRFMADAHDDVAAKGAAAYEMIKVRVFAHRMDVGEPFPADFAGASLIRLAHCHVNADRRAHFVAAQADVWNPGMAGAPGMRGGLFAQRGDTEFLVLSAWRSAAEHERYRTERFPRLRERSGVSADLSAITGDQVDVVSAWTVPAG